MNKFTLLLLSALAASEVAVWHQSKNAVDAITETGLLLAKYGVTEDLRSLDENIYLLPDYLIDNPKFLADLAKIRQLESKVINIRDIPYDCRPSFYRIRSILLQIDERLIQQQL